MEDIVARLRWLDGKFDIGPDLHGDAADEIERLREALAWCSGSRDFQEGGVARKGWLKLCAPLIYSNEGSEYE